MKQLNFTVLYVLCLYFIIEVQSGVLLDKLKIKAQNVKCDLHKIGNMIRPHNHQHEICNNDIHSQGTQTDFVDNRQIEIIPSTTVTNHNDRYVFVDGSTTEYPDIDIRGNLDNITEDENVTSSTGLPKVDSRRLIKVGSNCPEGSVADPSGKCREEFK